MSIWSEAISAVYDSPIAVDATLAPGSGAAAFSIRAMDKTSGVVFGGGDAFSTDFNSAIETILPVAVVSMAALTAAGITADDLDGGTITLDGKAWNVKAHRLKPSPDGELKGEVILILSDEAA